MTKPQPKLIANHIAHEFNTPKGKLRVLDNLNLTVYPNEFTTIVGTSGCGKSTFLNIVAGLIEPTEGTLLIDGKPIDGPGRDRGVVFQTYTLFPWLNVYKNVMFALKKSDLSRQEKQEHVEQYLDEVGLSGFHDAYPGQLSGGMQQRVAIARALVYSPSILLMDEPFGALDAQTRGMMQELLLRVWEEHKSTVIFITHDVDEAIFMSDRVFVMTTRPGSIKQELTVSLPHPRTYDLITTPEFIDQKREIIDAIRVETLKSMGASK